MEQIFFILIIILGIAGFFILIQYHKTQVNQYHKTLEQRATLLGTALKEAKSHIDKIQPLYEQYWKEHMENLAIGILRVLGKDISIRDDKYDVTMDYKNAILFKEPITVMPSHRGGTITVYGITYDPDLDFLPMGITPEALQKSDRDKAVPEDASVKKAIDGNSKRILEWVSGSALGSHFGLCLINSLSYLAGDEAEFGLMHLDKESIIKIIRGLAKETTGEEIDIQQ